MSKVRSHARERCILALALLATSPALAAGTSAPSSPNEQRALELFHKSEDSYRAGRLEEAVSLLQEAYRLKPDAVLLYDLGRAYEGLGQTESALDAYSRYLAAQPGAPDRGAIEQRIASLKQQIKERERLEKEREAAQERARSQRSPVVVPWVVLGIGAAGVVAGGVFEALALKRHGDAVDEPVGATAQNEQSQAQTFGTVAVVSFVAGGALVTTGAVWALLASKHRDTEPPPPVRAAVGPGSVSVAVALP